MANEDLKEKISQVQSNIHTINNEISAVNSELNQISNIAQKATGLLNSVHDRFVDAENNSVNALNYANTKISDVYESQLQIRELFFIFKDLETANKRIRALNNELFFDFRNQAKIRKIVTAFIDNLNLKLVSDETVYKAVEKEYLKAPDYWLAYVLLGIMHWKANDKEKVEQCVEEALKLNEKDTVLFMMQFNLILTRYDAALKWLKVYETLELTGEDDKTLLMIISSISSKVNNFDNQVDVCALEILEFVKKRLAMDDELVDHKAMVDNVCSFMNKLDTPETLQYANYRQYVADYQIMANILSKAKNNETILEYFNELSHINMHEKNLVSENYMKKLIGEKCSGEKKIYDEIAYNEEIIKAVDELKSSKTYVSKVDFKKIAEERYNAKKQHDEGSLNSVIETLGWSYDGVDEKITSLTKWNLFVLNKKYAVEAYNQYVNSYLSLIPKTHKVVIGDYNVETELKNKELDLSYIDKYIDTTKESLLKKTHNILFYSCVAVAIVLIALSIVAKIMIENNGIVLMILGLVLSGIAVIIGIFGFLNYIKKKRNISRHLESNRTSYKKIMDSIYEDKRKYDLEFNDAHKISNDVKTFFETI